MISNLLGKESISTFHASTIQHWNAIQMVKEVVSFITEFTSVQHPNTPTLAAASTEQNLEHTANNTLRPFSWLKRAW